MTRKDFFTLTFTLVGGAALAAGCSSSTSTSSADAGTDTGSDTGTHAAPDAPTDVGTDTGVSCTDPLPATQVADATGHTHTLTVFASTLSATSTQTLQTSGFPSNSSGAHFHSIMLTPADLATLRGGGSLTVTTSMDGDPLHSHMFMVSCH